MLSFIEPLVSHERCMKMRPIGTLIDINAGPIFVKFKTELTKTITIPTNTKVRFIFEFSLNFFMLDAILGKFRDPIDSIFGYDTFLIVISRSRKKIVDNYRSFVSSKDVGVHQFDFLF